jgi:integrase
MGCIYQRGNVWWIKYYRNGKPYMESSHSKAESKARRLLRKREGEIAKGELPGIYFDKIHFSELAEDFLTDYLINGKKTLDDAERNVKQLAEFFGADVKEVPPEEKAERRNGRRFDFSGGVRVTEITTAKIKEFIEARMGDGLSNASINRELAALKRMFHLGAQCTPPKVGQVPYIPMLKESNTRKGFFEHEEFITLREALPDHLKPVVTFAYHTGWRKEEILGLTWDKVDLKAGIVRLDPGEPKNKEGRTLYLNEELLSLMRSLQANRQIGWPYVFHRAGEKIGDFRKTWASASHLAEIGKKIFHDFRGTAIRNMIRSGIPERVAMTLSGHKTRSIFDRYNIVSQDDLKEAAKKQEIFIAAAENGYNLVTIRQKIARRRENPGGQVIDLFDEPCGARTRDHLIKSQFLSIFPPANHFSLDIISPNVYNINKAF